MKTEALLTPHMLAALTPKPREYTIFDAQCPGLAVRIQPTGAKSWVTWPRSGGKLRRVTLGKLADMTLDQARAGLLGVGHLRKRPHCMTFQQLADAFLSAKQGVYRPSTLTGLRKYLRAQLLPAFGAARVDQITTPQVAEWFHGYSRTSPGGANQALLHVTTILNWGKSVGHLPHDLPNPTSPLRKNRRAARGQMLNSKDVARLFAVLAAPPPPSS